MGLGRAVTGVESKVGLSALAQPNKMMLQLASKPIK